MVSICTLADLHKVDDNGKFEELCNKTSSLSCTNIAKIVSRNLVIRQRKEREDFLRKLKPTRKETKKAAKKPKTSSTNKASSSSPKNTSREQRILATVREMPPPEDLMSMVEEKKGRNLVLVITKLVFQSDISATKIRFQMPISKVTLDEGFLSKEERNGLLNKGHVKVTLVGPTFEKEQNMEIRKWNGCYVLTTTGWRIALEKYYGDLQIGDFVQVWSFRCNDGKDLWMRIVVFRAEKGSENVFPVESM